MDSTNTTIMADENQYIDYNLDPSQSMYGYRPDEGAAIAFIAIFSVLAIAHVVQGLRYKYWIVLPTLVTGCIGMYISYTVVTIAHTDR
jgi:hypothetical protein